MSEKAVAQKSADQALSTEVLDFLMENQGEGLDYDASELKIPFIRICQSNSPQINKRDAEYIEGIQVGDFFNTVTGQVWSGEEGIQGVTCYQETKYLKFIPREQGGGFLGELAPDDPQIAKAVRQRDSDNKATSKETLPDGNELVVSDQNYCLIVSERGRPTFGIVAMQSTARAVSKRWKTTLKMLSIEDEKSGKIFSPPVYGSMWRLKTVPDNNKKGDWYNYHVSFDSYILKDKELLEAAKAFRISIVSGEAQAVVEHDVVGGDDKNNDDSPF